jgi:hypothetical protein
MNDTNWVYVVYMPFCHVHQSAHVDSGVYQTPEAASYAAHRLLLSNCPQENDRVIIKRCIITDTTSALATLKGRERQYASQHSNGEKREKAAKEAMQEAINKEKSTKASKEEN